MFTALLARLRARFPPLYYCSVCQATVHVTAGAHVVITRSCKHATATVIAPRRAVLTGQGNLSKAPLRTRWQWALRSWATRVTGRCI